MPSVVAFDTAVSATITADNHYAVYFSKSDASDLTFVGRNEKGFYGNPGPYNRSLPETFNFNVNTGDYLYVVAWNDGGPRMWTGSFALPGGLSLVSDTAHWQYAVGSGGNPGESGDVPSLATLTNDITTAAWAAPAAAVPNGSAPWGTIPGIPSPAQFVAADNLMDNSPTDAHYVIFRTAAPVLPPNSPPAANDDSAATTKNTPVTIAAAALLANDSDPDGDSLQVIGVSAASAHGGTVTLGTNSVTYTPAAGYFGADSFQYTIQDSFGWTASATVTVSVVSPDAITATLTADNHYGLYFGSADGSTLTFVGRNEKGPTGNPGQYNWSLPETFQFEPGTGNYVYLVAWNDGGPQMWAGQLDLPGGVRLVSDTAHWQYAVAAGANPGESGDVPALADLQSTIASASWATPMASAPQGTDPWGTIPNVSSNAQFVWPDSLAAGSPTDAHYVVFRTVAPVSPANHPPEAGADFAFTNENTAAHISAADLLANDTDVDGDALQVISVTATSANGGTVTLNNNGTPGDPSDDFVIYTPAANFFGNDSFQYTIRDSFGWTATTTVFVSVNSIDGVAATVTADNHYGLYFGSGDGSALTLVGRNETGFAGNPGAYNWSLPESYKFNIAAGNYLYVLAWNDGGPAMWTGQFELPGGTTLLSNTTDWQYTVANGSNPGPDGALPALSDVMDTITNANWSSPQASAANGTSPWGTIPGISDNAQFIWHDTLDSGSSSDAHYVIFRTINAVERSPVFIKPADQSNVEADTITLQMNATDPDGHPLTFSAIGLPPGLSIDAATGLIQGTLAPGSGGIAGSISPYSDGQYFVHVTADDGHGGTATQSFFWNVAYLNRNPVLGDNSFSTPEGTPLTISSATLLSNDSDPDSDPLTLRSFTQPAHGTLSDDGAGTLTYSPNTGLNGDDSFTYTVSDGRGGSATAVVRITVIASSDSPMLANPGDRNNAIGEQVTLQLNAAAPPGDQLTYSAQNLPDGLTIDAQTGLVSGTIANNAGNLNDGRYNVTVGVTDGAKTATRNFEWRIAQAADTVNAMLKTDSGKGGRQIEGEKVIEIGKVQKQDKIKLGDADATAVAVTNTTFGLGDKRTGDYIRFGVASDSAVDLAKTQFIQFIKWQKPAQGGPPNTAVKDEAEEAHYFPFNQWHVDAPIYSRPYYTVGKKNAWERRQDRLIMTDRPGGPNDPQNLTYAAEGATFLLYDGKVVWYTHWKTEATRDGEGRFVSAKYTIVAGGPTNDPKVVQGLDPTGKLDVGFKDDKMKMAWDKVDSPVKPK